MMYNRYEHTAQIIRLADHRKAELPGEIDALRGQFARELFDIFSMQNLALGYDRKALQGYKDDSVL